MAEFALTTEQQAVLDASRQGVRRLKIEALAGTGKTSTLVELAKDLKVRKSRQRTLYIAFNHFIVDEVSTKISRFADAMTVNSLALRMVGKEFQEKLSETPQRMSLRQAADLLGVTSQLNYTVNYTKPNGTTGSAERTLAKEEIAGMTSRAILRFCRSLDRHIDHTYFDSDIFLGPTIGRVPIPIEVNQQLVEYAQNYWTDIADPQSRRFRFRHEHYMKLWHLSDPVIPYDTILFDEAQDADPLMRDVVERHKGQVVWCGDRYQAIYGWRGAVNAMQEVAADETLYLTQSFRFDKHVAEIANKFLAPLGGRPIIGAASHTTTVGKVSTPDVEIFRKNSTLIERFMSLAKENISIRTDVDLGEYERVVLGLIALRRGERPRHHDIAEFSNFFELKDWLRNPDVEDDEFRILLRQVLRHDLDELLTALVTARESTNSSSGRLLTTAHKAKGLGFSRVIVSDDFPVFSFRDSRIEPDDLYDGDGPIPYDKPWRGTYLEIPRDYAPELYKTSTGNEFPGKITWRCPPQEEWQLAYVAVTRSYHELSHPFEDVEQTLSREHFSSTTFIPEPTPVVDAGDFTTETPMPSTLGELSWSDNPDVSVAGTSFCQNDIRQLSNHFTPGDNGWSCTAQILREPDNPYDPHAVMVTIDGTKVGYLPKEFAPVVGTSLGNSTFDVPALIVGGYTRNGTQASFGVRLFLSWGD